ncbi:MAG: type II toxin-antitoxin system RelE/ParE family toxin [Acidobacteriota bacterium]
MALVVRWSPRAARQFEGILEYIGNDSERYARIFARQVIHVVHAIRLRPMLHRMVPEYGDPDLRERIHRGYGIVYRLKPDAVEIAAICHGSRLIEHALGED